MITRVVVAIPVRDESATIAECLRSIDIAAGAVGVPTLVVLAADSCTDDTVVVARGVDVRHCAIEVLPGRWARAGAARAAAVNTGLGRFETSRSAVWVANIDGDTIASPTWLVEQVRLARRYAAVAGVVELDPVRTPSALLERFRATYRLDGAHHSHVHGANLGVRADAYLDAGGWCPHTVVGEDHGLWNRLLERGHPVVHSTRARVVTSARVTSRVEGGFATDLRSLLVAEVGDVA